MQSTALKEYTSRVNRQGVVDFMNSSIFGLSIATILKQSDDSQLPIALTTLGQRQYRATTGNRTRDPLRGRMPR